MTDDARAALALAMHIERNHADDPLDKPHAHPMSDEHLRRANAILAAMPNWRLVPADTSLAYDTGFQDGLLEAAELHRLPAVPEQHKPGDSHRYRITCEVCGERGTIRLTVDPETALAPAPSEPG